MHRHVSETPILTNPSAHPARRCLQKNAAPPPRPPTCPPSHPAQPPTTLPKPYQPTTPHPAPLAPHPTPSRPSSPPPGPTRPPNAPPGLKRPPLPHPAHTTPPGPSNTLNRTHLPQHPPMLVAYHNAGLRRAQKAGTARTARVPARPLPARAQTNPPQAVAMKSEWRSLVTHKRVGAGALDSPRARLDCPVARHDTPWLARAQVHPMLARPAAPASPLGP
jgi:hypothetical protein